MCGLSREQKLPVIAEICKERVEEEARPAAAVRLDGTLPLSTCREVVGVADSIWRSAGTERLSILRADFDLPMFFISSYFHGLKNSGQSYRF